MFDWLIVYLRNLFVLKTSCGLKMTQCSMRFPVVKNIRLIISEADVIV